MELAGLVALAAMMFAEAASTRYQENWRELNCPQEVRARLLFPPGQRQKMVYLLVYESRIRVL